MNEASVRLSRSFVTFATAYLVMRRLPAAEPGPSLRLLVRLSAAAGGAGASGAGGVADIAVWRLHHRRGGRPCGTRARVWATSVEFTVATPPPAMPCPCGAMSSRHGNSDVSQGQDAPQGAEDMRPGELRWRCSPQLPGLQSASLARHFADKACHCLPRHNPLSAYYSSAGSSRNDIEYWNSVKAGCCAAAASAARLTAPQPPPGCRRHAAAPPSQQPARPAAQPPY